MTILINKNYRIQTIARLTAIKGPELTFTEDKLKDGLAIEKQCIGEKTYYVICFIKYNHKEDDVDIEIVGNRLLNVSNSEFDLFKELCAAASALVRAANYKGDDE